MVDQSHGPDDRAFPKMRSRQDDSIRAHPVTVFDDNSSVLGPWDGMLRKMAFRIGIVVVASDYFAARSEHHGRADRHGAELIRRKVAMRAAEKIVAYAE